MDYIISNWLGLLLALSAGACLGALMLAFFVGGDDPAEDYLAALEVAHAEGYVEGALDEHNCEREELRQWRQTATRNARLEQDKADLLRQNANLQIEVGELAAKLSLHRNMAAAKESTDDHAA